MSALAAGGVAAPLAAFALSWAALAVLLRHPRLLLDRPNERSLHERPVPRTGGIAIVAGSFAPVAALVPGSAPALGIALCVALVSGLDDWRSLGALPRLVVQVSAAAVYAAVVIEPVSLPESALFLLAAVWMCNLFNFMDGSDGLAGGMAVIGFGAYAIAALLAGFDGLAAWNAAIAAASLAFLWFNFHPARVFMGDAGSVTLGFLAACLGAAGWRDGAWPAVFPLVVFSPFIMDASLTLLRRVLAGERFWRAHRDHYYQRLVRMGLGHRRTALCEYALMLVSAAIALALPGGSSAVQLALAAAWLAALGVAALLVDLRWRRHNLQSRPQ